MKTAGLDGCRAGWLLISFGESSQYRLLRTDQQFRNALEEYDRIFIDMPIGLEDNTYSRKCDLLLRERLGKGYASSVFTPPIRPALHAPSYVEANMQSFELTEKKLSLQSWNIVPKIRQLDAILQNHGPIKEKVFESHPELLFMNLNRGIIYQKKNSKKGILHRLDMISEREPVAGDYFRQIKEEFRRNEVAEDDIVDAMVLALTAKESAATEIKTLPEKPERDSFGLVKAIHYI